MIYKSKTYKIIYKMQWEIYRNIVIGSNPKQAKWTKNK